MADATHAPWVCGSCHASLQPGDNGHVFGRALNTALEWQRKEEAMHQVCKLMCKKLLGLPEHPQVQLALDCVANLNRLESTTMVYEVCVVQLDGTGKAIALVLPTTTVLANDEKTAVVAAVHRLPSDLQLQASEMQVLVRPFRSS